MSATRWPPQNRNHRVGTELWNQIKNDPVALREFVDRVRNRDEQKRQLGLTHRFWDVFRRLNNLTHPSPNPNFGKILLAGSRKKWARYRLMSVEDYHAKFGTFDGDEKKIEEPIKKDLDGETH